jgi:hypothetical protein
MQGRLHAILRRGIRYLSGGIMIGSERERIFLTLKEIRTTNIIVFARAISGQAAVIREGGNTVRSGRKRMDRDLGKAKNGKHSSSAKFLSAFLAPPAEFNAGPPPCDLKEGDKVVVWDYGCYKWRAYFSHFEENNTYRYHCFSKGDKWSSFGETIGWHCCEKWEDENKKDDY